MYAPDTRDILIGTHMRISRVKGLGPMLFNRNQYGVWRASNIAYTASELARMVRFYRKLPGLVTLRPRGT